jgi:hypothetical protein
MVIKKVNWQQKFKSIIQKIKEIKKLHPIKSAAFLCGLNYFFSSTNTILLKSAAALITFLKVSNSLKGYLMSR